jgi:predicted nucleotidyltransferase
MGLIENYRDQILTLCKLNGVKSLYSFGSVNTSAFKDGSDVDLMVDFQTSDPLKYTENYFNLKFELEKILNKPIDLIEAKAIKNPYLKQSIDKSKILIYG